MTDPLPLPLPLFHIVSALSGHQSRRPSDAPSSALWLYNPTIYRPSSSECEDAQRKLLEFFLKDCSPRFVAMFRAEAEGLSAGDALSLFGDHVLRPELFERSPAQSIVWADAFGSR